MDIPNKSIEDYDARDLTRVGILSATDRLLQATPLDRLSVTDICREAHVSRQTFYKYFKDKYAICQWVWDQSAERRLTNPDYVCDWKGGTIDMLEAFTDRRQFVLRSLQSNDYNNILAYGRMRRSAFLAREAEKRCGGRPPEEILFAIDFFVESESFAISKWLQQGMPCTKERLACLIDYCVPAGLREFFDNGATGGAPGVADCPAVAKEGAEQR